MASAAAAAATPLGTSLEKRLDTSSHCGQYDTVTAAPYELFLDLWGEGDATKGS